MAAAAAAVAWDETLGGWTVSRYDLVREALRDPARFTSEGNPIAANLAGEAMLVTDSPVHDTVRSVWAKAFGPASVAARRAGLETLSDELLAPAIGRLHAGQPVDLVPIFEAFAGSVVLDLLGLEVSEERFARWYKLLLDSSAFAIGPGHPLHTAREEAKREVYDLLEAALADRRCRMRRGEEPEDLVALIAGAEGRGGITRQVVLDNLFNVFTGGADTTVRWMGNAVVQFHCNPDALDEVRADPALLPQALEEVMRVESVTRFAIRTVREDAVDLAGQPLSRGDIVFLLTSAANRDPAAFADPERFDIHRRGKPHLGFSHGLHLCIGMHLARIEAQAMLGRLLVSAPPFEVVEADYGDTSVVRGPQTLLVRAAR